MNMKAQRNAHGQLERKIVALLSRRSQCHVLELQNELVKLGTPYSLQAVYYVLRKLRREGVAVRMKSQYSLSLPWALELVELARIVEHNFLQAAPAHQLVPDQEASRVWVFRDLYALDDFWVHLMLTLVEGSSDKIIWNYCPHPWFYFSQRPKMERFYRVLTKQGARIKLIIGGNDKLDRLFSRSMLSTLYDCVHTQETGFGMDSHLMVIGEYVLGVRLAADAAARIDAAFSSATQASVEDVLRVQAATSAPTRARLSVSRNPRQARNHRAIFEQYF